MAMDAAQGLSCHSAAPTASQESAFTCPCPGPAHRAKQEMATAPRKQGIISFGSFLPDWSFPKCFVFTADGFWVDLCVSLGPCIGCGPALVPIHSKSHVKCSRNRLVLWLTAWKCSSQHSVAFQNWMWSTVSLQCFVRLHGRIICEEAKYRHAFL